MAEPTTSTIPAYLYHEKEVSQGNILGFWGNYAENLGEPSNGWNPFGVFEPSGFDFGDKATFSEVAIEQSLRALTAFQTKREADLKFVLSHIRPEIRNIMHGYRPDTLTVTPGTPTDFEQKFQGGGEYADIGNGGATIVAGGGDDPSSEVIYRQILMLFISPGFSAATTPTAKWGYIRFYKAYAHSPTNIVHGKEKHAMLGCTFRALSDMSISGPNKAYGIRTFGPKVP